VERLPLVVVANRPGSDDYDDDRYVLHRLGIDDWVGWMTCMKVWGVGQEGLGKSQGSLLNLGFERRPAPTRQQITLYGVPSRGDFGKDE